jgi:hypothetical protein
MTATAAKNNARIGGSPYSCVGFMIQQILANRSMRQSQATAIRNRR